MAQFVQEAKSMFMARFILFGIVLTQLADAFTFTYGIARFGIHLESNGIAAGIFHMGGLNAVLVVKGAVIVATTILLAYTAHRFPRLLVWGGATGTSMGLLGFAANSASIALLT
jgi:hypothetical protein